MPNEFGLCPNCKELGMHTERTFMIGEVVIEMLECQSCKTFVSSRTLSYEEKEELDL